VALAAPVAVWPTIVPGLMIVTGTPTDSANEKWFLEKDKSSATLNAGRADETLGNEPVGA
jgi:hypothetical protein